MIVWRRIKYGRIAHAFTEGCHRSQPICGRIFGTAPWTTCGDEDNETGHCVTCERKARAEPHDCLINGKPATVDEAARFLANIALLEESGVRVVIMQPPCPKCGSTKHYRSNPSPNWMNRWTCPKCGRHESR